jgi:hypothetical protein
MFAALLMAMAFCSAAAADTDFCAGGTLDAGAPLGTQGPDLVIGPGKTCTVDGKVSQTYNFNNVYIFGDGSPTATATLMFDNATMDFYAANILVQNGGVLQATGIGADNGGQVLTIHLYGNPGDPGVTCKKLDNGNVVDDIMCGIPAAIWNSNTMSMMNPRSCTKVSQLNPPQLLPGGVDDCFYQYGIFDNNDIAGAYFGHKVLALSYGGTINLAGAKGADYNPADDMNPAITGTSWVRLNQTLTTSGEKSKLVVSGAVDWQPNDNIVITSTDYVPGHAEKVVVATVTGNTINLQSPAQFPHYGQTYPLTVVPSGFGPDPLPNQMPSDRFVETRAAVGLLSRSIRIVSDGGAAGDPFKEEPGTYFGGHTVVRQGLLSYQIQGVEFYQLGQGGLKGHYPVHFHMLRQAPPGVYVKDSSIWDSMTRWITVHATQGVFLARNVGYKSIGHGFYLEDGTEADNELHTNLGVFARAAVLNDDNKRQVPGILARPGDPGAEIPPYHSDWDHPTVFWIMNGWNDFQNNFAAGAATCGLCYWLTPGGISGPSQYEYWQGYAGQQIVSTDERGVRAGLTPLENFVANSCSTAMLSFLNIGGTAPCKGVSDDGNSQLLQAVPNNNAPSPGQPGYSTYYPYLTSLRNPTLCPPGADCTSNITDPPCPGYGDNQKYCVVSTLERYTTSFNWAQKNFAAIWLRPWWFLVQDSAITDAQQGGLTFVTGGGYTRSDAAQGFWDLVRKSVFIGNTQPINPVTGLPDNPYASNAGPFNPGGLTCDVLVDGDFCLSKTWALSYTFDTFSVNQKMFSIYDGPAFQEKNAYLDVTKTVIGTVQDCNRNQQGYCANSQWMYGHELGVPMDVSNPSDPACYLPNAAIGWKQSNGFYYPPAFHSDELFFNNVDIRHFVIEPKFLSTGLFQTDSGAVAKRYCTYSGTLFNNFTDVDRQTELNDDNGSLTGLLGQLPASTRETISVNEDPFFTAPMMTTECASDIHADGVPATDPPATANTSPYEYVSTATIADCGINRAGCGNPAPGPGNPSLWGPNCTDGSGPETCYGVPLYRQYLTDDEYMKYRGDPTYVRPSILMMGQATGQRSTLTVNHAKYYMDDQVGQQTQQQTGATNLSVYQPGHTYYTFLVYAKPSTQQIYQIFVGKNLDPNQVKASIKPFRVVINDQNYQFNAPQSGDPPFINPDYDPNSGIATVNIDLQAYATAFASERANFCRPQSYCTSQSNPPYCVCADNSQCNDPGVCAWSVKDIDCPSVEGCFGFGIPLGANFKPGIAGPPAPERFTDDPNYSNDWVVPWALATTAGKQCTYSTPPN